MSPTTQRSAAHPRPFSPGRRSDRLYLLALLIPVAVYDLGLKLVSVAAREESVSLLRAIDLMRSDLLFMAGFGCLSVGLFSLAHRGILRRLALIFLHVLALLVVVVGTVAYQYLLSTGSTLDWNVAIYYLTALGEIRDVILGTAPLYAWVVLAAALLYVTLGPWLVVRLLYRRRASAASASAPRVGASTLEGAGLGLISVGLVALSLLPSGTDTERSFSLDPVVNLVLTGTSAPDASETSGVASEAAASLDEVGLETTPETERRNVVFILLESTRARSVTPYEPSLGTTPYLDELAERSLLVGRAYTTIPHTSKAATSINCGVYPDPETDIHEAEPGAVPTRCLPELLGEQGYNSAWFQSATEDFEDRPRLVENFGYRDFYGLEDMSRSGFERASYLGYEDDIMLEPSRRWLEENAADGSPFVATYLTITPHHEYLAPSERYGREGFVEDDVLNRYLNSVRYVDFFVKNLIQQYKDLGLYEDTVFIIVGDHGEAFGEHEVKGHDGVPYEEGQKVPLLIHDPNRWQSGKRVEGEESAINHNDLAPTVLDLLNYRVVGGTYPGRSILAPPTPRTLFAGCRPDLLCASSVKGDEKYIYHYGKRPDEFYDLSEDPLEKDNIADERPEEEIAARREEILRWRSQSGALYDR